MSSKDNTLGIPVSDKLKEGLEKYSENRKISQAGAARMILSERLREEGTI
jgi:hypothetical protein